MRRSPRPRATTRRRSCYLNPVAASHLSRASHITAAHAQNGRFVLRDSKSGHSVGISERTADKLHSSGHTITAVNDGTLKTRQGGRDHTFNADGQPASGTPTQQQADLQRVLGDRGHVRGFTDDMDHAGVTKAIETFKELAERFPNVPGGLQVAPQGKRGVNAKAQAIKIDGEYHISGIVVGPRLLEGDDSKNSFTFNRAVENGWFVGGADNVTHSIRHEYGHILDYYTGRKLSVGRAHNKAMAEAGIKPGADAQLWINKHTSGYARTDRDEAIAEAFADVESNGANASPISRVIYAELLRMVKAKDAQAKH